MASLMTTELFLNLFCYSDILCIVPPGAVLKSLNENLSFNNEFKLLLKFNKAVL